MFLLQSAFPHQSRQMFRECLPRASERLRDLSGVDELVEADVFDRLLEYFSARIPGRGNSMDARGFNQSALG